MQIVRFFQAFVCLTLFSKSIEMDRLDRLKQLKHLFSLTHFKIVSFVSKLTPREARLYCQHSEYILKHSSKELY